MIKSLSNHMIHSKISPHYKFTAALHECELLYMKILLSINCIGDEEDLKLMANEFLLKENKNRTIEAKNWDETHIAPQYFIRMKWKYPKTTVGLIAETITACTRQIDILKAELRSVGPYAGVRILHRSNK